MFAYIFKFSVSGYSGSRVLNQQNMGGNSARFGSSSIRRRVWKFSWLSEPHTPPAKCLGRANNWQMNEAANEKILVVDRTKVFIQEGFALSFTPTWQQAGTPLLFFMFLGPVIR